MTLGSALEPKWSADCEDTTLCLFMEGLPLNVNPENACTADAEWHIWYEEDNTMTQACEAHLGRALRWKAVKEFHAFGSACNIPRSWWIGEAGVCVSEERGVELGFLEYPAEA